MNAGPVVTVAAQPNRASNPVGCTPAPAQMPIPTSTATAIPGGGRNMITNATAHQMDRMANPDISAQPGALVGIRRMDEVHVYVDRFADNYTVALRPCLTGQEPPNGLMGLDERLWLVYETDRIPAGFSNRIRIAGAFCYWGGKGKEDDHMGTDSDYGWAPNDFDMYREPANWNLERSTRAENHIEACETQATNMTRVCAAIYGADWANGGCGEVERFRTLHMDTHRKFTAPFARRAGGALNFRRCVRESKAVSDAIRLNFQVGRPAFVQIKASGMTSRHSPGGAVFRRPITSDMDTPSGYFRSVILR